MNSCVVAQAIRKTIVLNTPCQTADATSGEQLLGDQLSMNVGEQSVQRQFVFQVGGVRTTEIGPCLTVYQFAPAEKSSLEDRRQAP